MSELNDDALTYLNDVQYIGYNDLYSRPDAYQELTVSFAGQVTHLFEHRGKTMFVLTLYEADPFTQMMVPTGDLLWYSDKTTNLQVGDYIESVGRIKGPHITFQQQLGQFWGAAYTFQTRSYILADQVPVVWLYGYEIWEDYVWGEEYFDYPDEVLEDFVPTSDY